MAEFKIQLGGKCVDCGATDDLEFDHVDPSSKSFEISVGCTRALKVVQEELKKCQLLCAPCHKIKSDLEQSVAHGQGLTGKKNCRCELCAPLKAAYRKRRKQASLAQ